MSYLPRLFVDVFLVIVPYLALRDILAMRQTCKKFMAMTRIQTVWSLLIQIHVLEKNIPVPGLAGRSAASLSAEELERLTRTALRLRKKWSSPSPATTRVITIHPTQRPGMGVPVALHFLPGRRNRWLLSFLQMNQNSMKVQCWDLKPSSPKCIASCHIVVPLSFVVNTDPHSRWVFAFQEPHIELVEIDFQSRDPEKGFISVPIVPLVRQHHLHLYTGSTLVTREGKAGLTIWDTNRPNYKIHLGTSDPENQKFEAGLIHEDFLIIARPTLLQIYSLSCLRGESSRWSSQLVYPIAQYKWQWRLHSISMAEETRSPSSRSTILSHVRILVRFSTTFPLPANSLHHFVMNPNELYTPTDPVDRHNIPYISPPTMLQTVASPVVPYHHNLMVVGRYGTALWIDSYNHNAGPRNVGQRLAGTILARSEIDGTAPSLASTSYVPHTAAASVFGLREGDGWTALAVDEEGGRIALANRNGAISLLHYT